MQRGMGAQKKHFLPPTEAAKASSAFTVTVTFIGATALNFF